MRRANEYALNAAKEITIARVSNTSIHVTKEGGESVAEFFEAVYKKILELTSDSESE